VIEIEQDREYEDWCSDQYDEFTAGAYDAFIAEIVRAAYAKRVQVGEVDRGAYYDITTYTLVASGVTVEQVRKVLSAGDGQAMASFGIFGGYSTIGRVQQMVDSGTFVVESVYHIGD